MFFFALRSCADSAEEWNTIAQPAFISVGSFATSLPSMICVGADILESVYQAKQRPTFAHPDGTTKDDEGTILEYEIDARDDGRTPNGLADPFEPNAGPLRSSTSAT